MIPNEISDEVLQAATEEMKRFFREKMGLDSAMFAPVIRDTLTHFVPLGDYQPLTITRNTTILPVKQTNHDNNPLCVKFGTEETVERKIHLINNRRADLSLETASHLRTILAGQEGVVHVPQRKMIIIPRGRDWEGLDGILTIDLTRKGEYGIQDLHQVAEKAGGERYMDPPTKGLGVWTDRYRQIRGIVDEYLLTVHQNYHGDASLDSALKRVLFVVGGDEANLYVADTDHIEFVYGRCSACGEDSLIKKPNAKKK